MWSQYTVASIVPCGMLGVCVCVRVWMWCVYECGVRVCVVCMCVCVYVWSKMRIKYWWTVLILEERLKWIRVGDMEKEDGIWELYVCVCVSYVCVCVCELCVYV